MKPILQLLIAALLTFHVSAEPIDDFLFPPDLIVRAQEEVKLTEAQRQHLREVTDKMEARVRELQETMRKENDAFVALVKPERVDPQATLAQLNKLLDAERDMKRAHVGFMLAIKNELTPEQQAKLAAFRKAEGLDRATMQEFQKRFVVKAERVRIGVERIVSSGGDPSPVAAVMEDVRKMMEQGKPKDAEAAIDRALKLIGEAK